MIVAAVILISAALVLFVVSVVAKRLTYEQRALMATIAAGMSFTGAALAFLSRFN